MQENQKIYQKSDEPSQMHSARATSSIKHPCNVSDVAPQTDALRKEELKKAREGSSAKPRAPVDTAQQSLGQWLTANPCN